MPRSAAAPARTTRGPLRSTALRAVAAAGLAVSAYLHADLAEGPLAGDGQITLAGLFIAQAVVAIVVAVAVLARPSRLVWLAVAVVGLGSLAALVLSVYVQVPAVGPFPTLYEPLWYGEKVAAAVAAAVAGVTALVALGGDRRR
jgi:hypothetical protein